MSDPEIQKVQKVAVYSSRSTRIASMFAHLAVFFLTAFICYSSFPDLTWFPWHPFLMALGFVFFMTEAIMLFSSQNGLIKGERKTLVKFHWLFQLGMAICAIGGFITIWFSKEERGKYHFVTWHGLLGLILTISALSQCVAGIPLLYPNVISKFVTLATAKIFHAAYGACNYILMIVVLNLAFWSNWALNNLYDEPWYASVICINILGLVILSQITNSILPRLRTPDRQ